MDINSKKILIRGKFTPDAIYSTLDNIKKDTVNDNSGNILYMYSVMRHLMVDDSTTFIPTDANFSPEKNINWINEQCSMFAVCMADAFRLGFDLDRYTQLIEKLTIPCVVIGVGLRADFDYNGTKGFQFDNSVKKFVNAVLDKSSIIGLRGENTAKYLESLGYIRDKHFTVIGCPSMYMYGNDITPSIWRGGGITQLSYKLWTSHASRNRYFS